MLAQLLADRAVVASRAGDPAGAATHVEAALSRADTAYVQDVAGLVALADGDVTSAMQAFDAALVAGPDDVLRVAILNNLARARASADQRDDATSTARSALALGETLGDRHRLAALHANLADRLHEQGSPEEAMTHFKAAAALFAEVGAEPLDRPDIWTLTAW